MLFCKLFGGTQGRYTKIFNINNLVRPLVIYSSQIKKSPPKAVRNLTDEGLVVAPPWESGRDGEEPFNFL